MSDLDLDKDWLAEPADGIPVVCSDLESDTQTTATRDKAYPQDRLFVDCSTESTRTTAASSHVDNLSGHTTDNSVQDDQDAAPQAFPTVHIISDSLGETARAVAQAAAAQFGVLHPKIEVLYKVTNFEQVRDHLLEHARYHVEQLGDSRLLVFYTLVHGPLRDQVSAFIDSQDNIVGVDLLTGAIDAMAIMSGREPSSLPGAVRTTDIHYFRRVEALEFTISHDDGRNPHELTQADIVILGVSRTSKTPLSIYLAQQGYKVANVPLDLQTDPPKEVYNVDPTRLFGLMTTPDVLHDIRARRIKGLEKAAGRYADTEYIYEDLEHARALMRRLGCYVLRTDRRAVEEVAQELLSYYLITHPA